MNPLLQKHQCILLQLRRETFSVRQLLEFLDDLIEFFNRNVSNRLDGYRLLTTICFDFAKLHHLGIFNHLNIIEHPFFILLSRTFGMLFTKLLKIWLSNEEKECLDAISLFIINLCLHKNEVLTNFYIANNEKFDPETSTKSPWISYEKIFLTETFRLKFRSMFEENFSTNRIDAADDLKYQLATRFLGLWMKLNQTDVQFIFNGIVECLKSEIYIEVARSVDLRQYFLNPKERLFLYQCPKFLQTMFFNDQEKISQSLCEHFVDQSERIFQKQLSVACEGELTKKLELHNKKCNIENEKCRGAKIQSISWHIELLNFFALIPSARFYFIKKSFEYLSSSDDQKTMVDQMIQIIKSESLIESVAVNRSSYHADVSIVRHSLVLLYNLVFEEKILRYLKEKKVIKILKHLSQAKDRTIQFTSTTLLAILQKENLDQESNHPTQIARSYLYLIENTIDEVSHIFHGIKLDGVLTNLELIVQNEDVKEEIVNDDGLSLLGECSYRADLDFQTIQYPALRIIETISFANEAPKKLIENERLIEHLNDLSKSNDKIQSPISTRILWIAENEDKFIVEQMKDREEKTKRRLENVFSPMGEFHEKKAIYQYITGDYRWHIGQRLVAEKCDLLLNFSSSDRILAQKIQHQLKLTELYDVYLLEVNEKDDPILMAYDIENAPIVIICCSNEYRNSNASRLEAKFIQKRNKPFIGLKTEENYENKGWLKDLFQTKKMIYFNNNDFQSSVKRLVLEIQIINNENRTKSN